MRPTNSNTISYQPGNPPADPTQLQRYIAEEQLKIKAVIDALAEGFLPVVYSYPAKPRVGMLRNFDGVQCNPGSGEGLYRYDGTAWKFLG